ncbi:MAG: DMT family transporter [Acidobacteria bacterium]|nr:DMT family transporter [Acidobacteriota bacterium]
MQEVIRRDETSPGRRATEGFPLRAYFGMSVATVLWASNTVAVKLAVQQIPPLALTSLRVTLAAITLAAAHWITGGMFYVRPGERANLFKLSLTGVALSFLFLTTGLSYTSVSHAVFINALVPMAVLLIARAHGMERITAPKVAGLLLSLGGVLALVMDHGGGRAAGWKGDLLIMISVSCFALFTVESKKLGTSHSPLEFTAFAFIAAAVTLTPLFAFQAPRVDWNGVTWIAWAGLLYSAVFGSAGAYLTYTFSLRLLPPSRAAAFHYMQPVLATFFGVAIFHDRFTAQFALGATLILAGLAITRQRWLTTP